MTRKKTFLIIVACILFCAWYVYCHRITNELLTAIDKLFVGKWGVLPIMSKNENPQSLSFQWIADVVGTPSGVRIVDASRKR